MSTATTQDESKSPAGRVIDRIAQERFTGLLRVRAREASGEFWFLAGILEDAQFGVSKGEEALERLQRATELVFEADPRLPSLSGTFKKRMPPKGTFAEARPVALMRHCETYALTCLLELKGKERTVRATYRMGELLSADAGLDGNEALPALLESEDGVYEFVLPAFELPPGVNAALSAAPSAPEPGRTPTASAAPAAKPSLAERIDRSLLEESAAEAKRGEELRGDRRHDAEESAATAKRNADDAAAHRNRMAEEVAAEAKRTAEAESEKTRRAVQAEAKRRADEAAEAKRKADEAAKAKRRADEAAEAKRKADEAAKAKRRADEAAEAKRKADEAAEAKRRADAASEQARRAAQVEAKRKADDAAAELKAEQNRAEAKRLADADAQHAAKRRTEAVQRKADESVAEGKRRVDAEVQRHAEKPVTAQRVTQEPPARETRKSELDAQGDLERDASEAKRDRKEKGSEATAPAKLTQKKQKTLENIAERASSEPAPIVASQRSSVWVFLLLALIAAVIGYFLVEKLR